MELARAWISVFAKTDQAEADVKKLEGSVKASGASIAKTFATAFSAVAIGAGLKNVIGQASDLNEQVNRSQLIFGNSSKAIDDYALKAAKGMGLSATAYRDATSTLGGLLQNLGFAQQASLDWSQKLTQLGSDLGSAFNKDPAEAVAAIGSALRGETEPIRAFNVQIDEARIKAEALKLGLYDGTGAIDANAKATATLALIYDQTKSSQGDFANTATGVANAQRIAKAETDNAAAALGQNLLPIYGKAIEVVTAVVKGFGALPGPVQTGVLALLAFVALAGPIGNFVDVIGKVKTAISGLSGAGGGLLAIAGVLVAAYAVFSQHDDSQAQLAARAKEVAGNLKSETDQMDQQRAQAGTATTAVQALADAHTALSKALTGGDEKGQRLAKALGALGIQSEDAAHFLSLLADGEAGLGSNADIAVTAAQKQAVAHAALARQFLIEHGVALDLVNALVEAGQGASFMGDASDLTKEKMKGWTAENKALADAMIEVGKQAGNTDIAQIATDYLNGEVASNQFKASLVAQAEAQTGVTRAGADASKVYEAYRVIVETLNPEQQKLFTGAATGATSMSTLATATGTAADATDAKAKADAEAKTKADNLRSANDALGKSIDRNVSMYDAMKTAMDQLSKAFDAVLGGSLGLEEADRAMQQAVVDTTKAIADNGTTLDIMTESGRKNRAQVEDQAKSIIAYGTAMVRSGHSNEEAAAFVNEHTRQLREQLIAAGLSEAEVDSYIKTLNLTPENVDTAIRLAGDEAARLRIKGLQDQLGVIGEGAAAEITAMIDRGALAEAETALKQLARQREVNLIPRWQGGGPNAVLNSGSGRYVPAGANILTTVSEPGAGDEVIFPLNDPRRIRELMAANGVGQRILAAAGTYQATGAGAGAPAAAQPAMVGGSTTTIGNQGVHIEHAVFSDAVDAQGLAQVVLFHLAAT